MLERAEAAKSHNARRERAMTTEDAGWDQARGKAASGQGPNTSH
jgi:hypothetical protein